MDVEVISDIRESVQLSFTVLSDSRIIISRQGHRAVNRKLSLDSEDVDGGGWIFLKSRKITFYSGAYAWVDSKKREDVREAICQELRIHLRITT